MAVKATARRREVESLIGKLQFLAKCIKAGRIFLSRLINWIRRMDRNTEYAIPIEARKDIAWWGRCANEYNITLLEILAVMVALKVWGSALQGLYFWIHVDNKAVASVLNTGACRDAAIQNVLREIALIAARIQFVIKAKHILGISNRKPDWLSRWHEPAARKQFRELAKDSSMRHIRVLVTMLELDN